MRDNPIIYVVGSVVLLAAGFFAGDVIDLNVSPKANAPAEEICPAGWANVSDRDLDHVVLACQQGNWIVVLNEDKTPSYGYMKDTAGAKFICPETNTKMIADGLCVKGTLPGWPAPSSPSP